MSEKETGQKNRAKRVVLIVLLSLIAAAVLYALFVLFANPLFYGAFYDASERAATIPDLWGGFIPQGVCSLEGNTLICGYSSDGPSRIYVIGTDGAKKLYLHLEDGGVYDGHAGGVTTGGGYVYISNASKIFVLRASDVLGAPDGADVRFIGSFPVPCRSSFCSFDGASLCVGEFHRDGYATDESHRVATDDGTYQAMIFAYALDPGEPFGVKTEPGRVYAVCDEVQGAAFDGGLCALSCSFGLSSSRIRFYDAGGQSDGTFLCDGRELPMYVLDARREKATLSAPHMSEDLEFVDGKLLIAFESGVLKYGGGLLPFSERGVMLLDPEKVVM